MSEPSVSFRRGRIQKGLAFVLSRSDLEPFAAQAKHSGLREIFFKGTPGSSNLEAEFQGAGRRNAFAGNCALVVGCVPSGLLEETRSLLLKEALPQFLLWLATTQKESKSKPLGIFHWRASAVAGKVNASTATNAL